MSRLFDLKLRLALRVVGLAALCFLAASAYLLIQSDRAAQARAEAIAKLVASDLEMQQDQLHWIKVAGGYPAPDLEKIAIPLFAPGVCIAYRAPDGMRQRVCNGRDPSESDAPAGFAALYRFVFKPGQDVSEPIVVHDERKGEAVVTLDPESLIAQSWRETSRLLTVMAVTFSALCLLVYAAI